jgi:hypothetical protein
MATATKTETSRERLEAKRDALVLRRAELVELIDQSPASIAQLRMTYFHSESPADQRKLQQAQKAQEAAEAELVEVDESVVIVDRLLSEFLAEEAEKARAALEAKLGELRAAQAEAFRACAGKFAELFDLWKAFAASEETLQAAWWTCPGREGAQPGHLLDPTPASFEALLGVLYRAALRRGDIGYQLLERVTHLVPDLGRDVGVELSGQGTQSLRSF